MNSPDLDDSHTTDSQVVLLADLHHRARTLLYELHAFQQLLQQRGKSDIVDIRKFNSTVETELKALNKVNLSLSGSRRTPADSHDDNRDDFESERQHVHALRSSNLPFYEAVWRTAKSCRGVRAVGKRFYFSAPSSGKGQEATRDLKLGNGLSSGVPKGIGQTPAKKHVLVDVVADLEWVKVSTVTEKRLLFELAKEGWTGYDDDEDGAGSEDDESGRNGASHAIARPDLEIVRIAQDLAAASKQTRIRYQHPRIHFVLPKITEGRVNDIDKILDYIRATGATVQVGGRDGPLTTDTTDTNYESMLPGPPIPLTSRLNIDCTILLALISDISHLSQSNLPPPPTTHFGNKFHAAILHQIATEQSSPLLPSEIYPLLDGRTLECTDAAAKRMREIVQTMGTPAEKIRADIFLAEGAYAGGECNSLRDSLAKESEYAVPEGLRLPIKVVRFDAHNAVAVANGKSGVKVVANRLLHTFPGGLSAINSSVFLYGWFENVVTVTSNKAVAVGIERCVGEILDELERDGDDDRDRSESGLENGVRALEIADEGRGGTSEEGGRAGREHDVGEVRDCEGPKMWIVETARSLIGKDKGRREG